MSAEAAQRVGRFYTAARRHPWVLGKIGDFRLWFGPYNPAQIAVAVLGALLLIMTVSWWTALGPLPLVTWLLAIWAVRRPRIAGRAPLAAIGGWVTLWCKPAGGQIGGKPARDKRPQPLLGGFVIEDLPSPTSGDRRRPRRRTTPVRPVRPERPQRRAATSSRPPRPRPDRQPRPAGQAPRRAPNAAGPSTGPVSSVQRLAARAAALSKERAS
ncbi:hypothetical protein G6045_28255 [Streptomyces sp. YC504]|uniref:Uncharacterized protein n=1 Tax=Streptomyces mesophilus TaxID=1775132 RepID=A0A6G4XPL4_9ACTN|nr:hypothetical protein [Streptomyces mesophilus]NGO79516.1 hypothetical protein [Streptomyces mesophilus]